jgi:hypothetical protein
VCPNLSSQLHFSHNQEGDYEVHDGHVVALENNNIFVITEKIMKHSVLGKAKRGPRAKKNWDTLV